MNYQRGRLGDLPEDLSRYRRGGAVFDPSSGLALDWINRYKTTVFGFILQTGSQAVLQDNPLRTYLLIQNQSAATDIFLSFTNDAAANDLGSIIIIPRGNYELIGGEAGGAFVPKASVNMRAAAADTRIAVVEGTLEPYELASRL